MANEGTQHNSEPHNREPRGLGEHARGLASEYAHEQGWGLEQDQRTRLVGGTQDTNGGTDYDYGARDFGDEPHRVGHDGIADQEADAIRSRMQEGRS